MGYVAEAIRFNSTTSGTSKTGAFLVNVPVGRTLLVAVQAPSTTASTSFTFTDTAGNTYTKRAQQAHSTPINNQIAVFGCTTTAAITAGVHTWTATSTDRTPNCWVVLGEFFDDLSGFDTTAGSKTASGAATTALTSGATATASQNSELVFDVFGFTDVSSAVVFTPESGYTAVAKATAAITTPKSLVCAWRYVNAAGTRTANASTSTNTNWTAACLPYKATLAAGTPSGAKILKTGGNVSVEVTL